MRNLVTLKQRFLSFSSWGWLISLLLGCGFNFNLAIATKAESAKNAPEELTAIITQIEEAANRQDIEGVMKFYDSNFDHSDGLRRSSVAQSLRELWAKYSRLNYRTELQSWDKVGDELVAETLTYIQGTQRNDGRVIRLDSTLRSRQYFVEQKLIRQEIIAERTELNSGTNPPKIQLILPETVNVGDKFNFDVIVTEPLGEDLLLGAAVEEQAVSNRYLNPNSFELELLPAGGIFKLVKAPLLPDNHWYSAILVRGDGMTLITQRVKIEK